MSADRPFINDGDTDYHQERQEFAVRLYDRTDLLPHRYVFILTNKCNLRCSFCFQEKKSILGAMTGDDWIRLVDQLPPYAWVTITGGEPFFFKEFDRVFEYVAARFKCNIITNGLLLDEVLIERLLSFPNFRTLSVSIDDIGNRVRDIAPDQWRRAENAMRYFGQRTGNMNNPPILDAKTVVLDANAAELLAIHRYCIEDLGCATHSFQLLKGSPLQHADMMQPLEAIFRESSAPVYDNWELICAQLEQVRQYDVAQDQRCYLHPKIADLNGSRSIAAEPLSYINERRFNARNYHPCKAMWESVHVNVDGEVFPCMAVSMGNIKTQPLATVIHGEKAQALKSVLKEQGVVEGCNRCGYLRPVDALL